MEVLIVYALVLIFLIAFPLLVIFFVHSPESSSQQHKVLPQHVDKASYGLLVVLFALLFVLTFVMKRGQS